MTTPPSQVPSPAPLWPPPRTASRTSLLAGEVDDPGHVVGVGAARHQGGTPVDHRVVDRAGLLVAAVGGADQLSLEARDVHCAGGVHVSFSLLSPNSYPD